MTVVLILAIAVCAYMAWNIGANDVANAMGTSVGSKALTLRQAVIIAAIFEFCGAFFAGDAVTDTVRKGILTVDFETVTDDFANDLMYGFISAMMAAAVWLTVATRFGLPVSTTHSIIGGIVGIGLILEIQHSITLIDWEVVRKVVISWVASPLMGGILAFSTFYIIRLTILEAENPVVLSITCGGASANICCRILSDKGSLRLEINMGRGDNSSASSALISCRIGFKFPDWRWAR